MLLKKASKRARSGFKRKKLDVKGTYQQISSSRILPNSSGLPDLSKGDVIDTMLKK